MVFVLEFERVAKDWIVPIAYKQDKVIRLHHAVDQVVAEIMRSEHWMCPYNISGALSYPWTPVRINDEALWNPVWPSLLHPNARHSFVAGVLEPKENYTRLPVRKVIEVDWVRRIAQLIECSGPMRNEIRIFVAI